MGLIHLMGDAAEHGNFPQIIQNPAIVVPHLPRSLKSEKLPRSLKSEKKGGDAAEHGDFPTNH